MHEYQKAVMRLNASSKQKSNKVNEYVLEQILVSPQQYTASTQHYTTTAKEKKTEEAKQWDKTLTEAMTEVQKEAEYVPEESLSKEEAITCMTMIEAKKIQAQLMCQGLSKKPNIMKE